MAVSNVRAHPTVRPYALALGVMPRRGQVDRLGFLGPSLALDVTTALLLDTLGALSTFPVRHRVVFVDGDDPVMRQTRLPATWREHAARGAGGARLAHALEDLCGLGAEAVVLISADGPMFPLGPLFDAMMWLLPKKRLLLGSRETIGSRSGASEASGAGLYVLGAAEPLPFLSEVPGALGLGGRADDVASVNVEATLADRAREHGLEVQSLPSSYQVDSPEMLARLKADVAGGMFAPHCRKLFEGELASL